MGIQTRVDALKKQLEQLFPGKLVSGRERRKILLTGLPDIDSSLPHGLARQRITQWSGQASSGKSTILRAAIANWCAAGLSVAYIDVEGRLSAPDWAFVDEGIAGAVPSHMVKRESSRRPPNPGRFWVVRGGQEDDDKTDTWRRSAVKETKDSEAKGREEPPAAERLDARRRHDAWRRSAYIWTCEQLIRSHAFDVVVLDLGNAATLTSRAYARLGNALARSRTALITTQDSPPSSDWGCHCRLSFRWGEALRYEAGLSGIAMIVPTVRCTIWQNGRSQTTEVALVSHVSNRLFTHPPVPDRRTSKA